MIRGVRGKRDPIVSYRKHLRDTEELIERCVAKANAYDARGAFAHAQRARLKVRFYEKRAERLLEAIEQTMQRVA